MMNNDDPVLRQGHELCGGIRSVWRIGRREQENWMVVDAVKNLNDSKPAEVDREDWMMRVDF